MNTPRKGLSGCHLALALALALLLCSAVSAPAQVSSVQVYPGDGTDQAAFDGTTLAVHATSTSDVVTVNEMTALTGFTNMSLSLTTTYDSVLYASGHTWGKFVGGRVDLRFDDGVHFYELTGNIPWLALRIDTDVGLPPPTVRLSGETLFRVASVSLPANPIGGWAGAFSWIKNIAFDVEQDMTGYDWANPAPWVGSAASQWQFIPETIPEPTTLTLLALAALFAVRRRGRIDSDQRRRAAPTSTRTTSSTKLNSPIG